MSAARACKAPRREAKRQAAEKQIAPARTPARVDLALPDAAPAHWKSASRRAGADTEAWAARELYCVACDADRLSAHRVNQKVEDFHCPDCDARYQLKAKQGRYGASVTNSDYARKMAAIAAGTAPNYTFLSYAPEAGLVTDLFLVPRHFMVESVVRPRNPLKPPHPRAGWVGSTILLGDLPPDARLPLVVASKPRRASDVRRDFKRFAFLDDKPAESRGWTTDVLACVRRLGPRFTLDDVYAFEDELAAKHPANRNVRPKIRQQLQVLRDKGVVAFEGRGVYRAK